MAGPAQQPPGAARMLPVTQRLVVRYAKRGRMRFASHRDIARAVERGVRRAGLPIAHSAGFTPHPKISYAGAAPTGTASEAEYLELSFTEECSPADVRDRLDAALPNGIDVIDVTAGTVPLGALPLEASQWQLLLPGIAPSEADAAIAAFLALDSVEVERLTSKGTRRVDARAAVVGIETTQLPAGERDAGNAALRMVVRHVTPAVRPDDILAALRQVAALTPASPPVVTRLAQGPLPAEGAGAPAVAGDSAAAGEGAAAGGDHLPAAPRRPGVAHESVETTLPGPEPADAVGARPAGAHNHFPRGAEDPARTSAPGNLTGDHPDARNRAERQRDR